ncbi:MAG TPA: Rieske 2Fe-2S domain-containing protein [Solirubrobacter sp.]
MLRAVCRLSDLPATQGYLVEVAGQAVAIFRVGDAVHALENRCPHRDAPLAFGDLKGATVYCPLHAWDFDVRTGRCGELPNVAVRTFPVEVRGEDVLLEVPEEGIIHGDD